MGLKFVAFALLAILSVQGFADAKYISSADVQARGVVDDIHKVVEEIKGAIVKLIVEGVATVKDAFDKIMVIAKQELNKALETIQKLVENALVDIKELEDLAVELGLDVKECVEEQKPRLHELAEKTREGIKQCVADLAAEFQKLYEDLLKATSDAYDRIFALVGEFDECQDWTCRGNVAKKLVSEMANISGQVRVLVDNAVRSMQQQIPTVVKCIKEQVAAFKAEVAEIVADIKACVAAATHGDTRDATRSIQEDIQKLVEKVKQAIKDVVENGIATLKEAYEKLVAFAKKLVADAKNKIEQIAQKLASEIEEIKKKAEELGLDIKECVEQVQPKIDALIAETNAEINACVETTLAAAKGIFENVLALNEEIKKEFENLVNTLRECQDAKCVIDAGVAFAKVLARLGGEVKDLIKDSVHEINQAVVELTKCTKPTLEHYIEETKNINNEFRQCFEAAKKQ